MTHLLFIFLDGVGIGAADARSNPFMDADIPTWRALAGNTWPTLPANARFSSVHATIFGAAATLGVPGEPQSGTGTTSLLTGHNAAAILGQHAGPFPPAPLRELLEQENLLSQARASGRTVAFANAYPPFYLERLERNTARRTTCTQAALAAGIRLRGYEELVRGQALSSWVTNQHWRRLAPDVPDISPRQAGINLARLALQHEVTLFEYFQTDHQGHRPDLAAARDTLRLLDRFLAGAVSALDPERDLLVIASDHGNFEAQDHPNHTQNPSLVTIWGRGHEAIANQVQQITDIVPALLNWLHQQKTPLG
jgi:2,3-bisphosphoglycerate-independent phosphoglycerate mutase